MNLVGKVGCLVMLLVSICEINAGIVTIKNETGRDLMKVNVHHWGYSMLAGSSPLGGSSGKLKGTYSIKKAKKIEHDLVLDRLESIFVEALGAGGMSGPSGGPYKMTYSDDFVGSEYKYWPNKHSSSKNRTITIKVAKGGDGLNQFVISDKLS